MQRPSLLDGAFSRSVDAKTRNMQRAPSPRRGIKAMAAKMPLMIAVAAFVCLAKGALCSSLVPSPSPPAVGMQGYRRFHANDSLIGRPVPCTYEEKLCFGLNLYYDSTKHDCYERYIAIADREQFWHKSGHLTPLIDPGPDYCPGIRMAYDSICYQTELVHNIICGCNTTTIHILGGSECRCSPSTPIHVQQPEEEGRCGVPDLRFPSNRTHFFRSIFEDIQGFRVGKGGSEVIKPFPRFTCSVEQAECFSEGKVWVAEGQGCFPLLEKGPCAEDHVVALDVQAARVGRAESTCVHVRGGCPQGHVRMSFDGQCHSEYDLSVLLPYKKDINQFGIYFPTACGYKTLSYIPVRESSADFPSMCYVNIIIDQNYCPAPAYIPCHSKAGCTRYEVISTPPKPE